MHHHSYQPFTALSMFLMARLTHSGADAAFVLLGVAWCSVFVHELGHAAVALFSGERVTCLMPTPFMGITSFESGPPRHPIWLSLAGPLAGATFGVGALVAIYWLGLPPGAPAWEIRTVLWATLLDNLVFNLLPVGSLDGAHLRDAIREHLDERAVERQAERLLQSAWRAAYDAPRTPRPVPRLVVLQEVES